MWQICFGTLLIRKTMVFDLNGEPDVITVREVPDHFVLLWLPLTHSDIGIGFGASTFAIWYELPGDTI